MDGGGADALRRCCSSLLRTRRGRAGFAWNDWDDEHREALEGVVKGASREEVRGSSNWEATVLKEPWAQKTSC